MIDILIYLGMHKIIVKDTIIIQIFKNEIL